MATYSKYKAEPFHPIDLESNYREIENQVSLFTFLSIGQTIQHWKRDPKSIQTWMKKIHCLYKRNPFLKTAAKEKPPAGLMVWPAKLANVEMIIKWQHPRGPSIPNQSLQRMWQATCVPQGKSPFFQAIWHIIHRIFGSQL